MTDTTVTTVAAARVAVLDDAHIGDIHGALGTIRLDDHGERRGLSAKLKTLLAIVGPGLIVMVGDNDAGAFATYGQAGQNYSTHLLWTLLLLVPVLYINQEMVLRLGAVTGVGHARLILERFGKFWGAFSVIDLFLLNALTLVTEFVGITLSADYLGLPKAAAVVLAAVTIVASAFTGSFRRFERVAMTLCAASLLLVPIYFMVHPHASQMAADFVTPNLPGGPGQLSTVMLLIIGIVCTTVAPLPAPGRRRREGFLRRLRRARCRRGHDRPDPRLAAGPADRGRADPRRRAAALRERLPPAPVQRQVLGPWVNGPKTNAFTAAVVGVLVTLSVILTASVLFPDISADAIIDIMAACAVAGVLAAGYAFTWRRTATKEDPIDRTGRDAWRMPPLESLTPAVMSSGKKIGMGALRTYLLVSMILVVIKIVQVAVSQ